MSISLVGCAKSSIFSHQPQRSQPSNSFNPPNLMNSTPLHLLSPTTLLQQSTIYKLAVEIVSCFSSSFFFNVFFVSFFLWINWLFYIPGYPAAPFFHICCFKNRNKISTAWNIASCDLVIHGNQYKSIEQKGTILKCAVGGHSSLVNLVRKAVMLWRMSREMALRKMPVAWVNWRAQSGWELWGRRVHSRSRTAAMVSIRSRKPIERAARRSRFNSYKNSNGVGFIVFLCDEILLFTCVRLTN